MNKFLKKLVCILVMVSMVVIPTVSVSAQENVVETNSVIIGDTDLNGAVNITDATTIQLYLVNKPRGNTVGQKFYAQDSNNEYVVGDTDLDGKITIIDATNIQCYLARLRDNGKINLTIEEYETILAKQEYYSAYFKSEDYAFNENIIADIYYKNDDKLHMELKDVGKDDVCNYYACAGHTGSHGIGRGKLFNDTVGFKGYLNGIESWCFDAEPVRDSEGNIIFYDDNNNNIKDADESYMYQCKGNCTEYHYNDVYICEGHTGSHGQGKINSEGKLYGCLGGISGWCSNVQIVRDDKGNFCFYDDNNNGIKDADESYIYECKGNCTVYHKSDGTAITEEQLNEYDAWNDCNNKKFVSVRQDKGIESISFTKWEQDIVNHQEIKYDKNTQTIYNEENQTYSQATDDEYNTVTSSIFNNFANHVKTVIYLDTETQELVDADNKTNKSVVCDKLMIALNTGSKYRYSTLIVYVDTTTKKIWGINDCPSDKVEKTEWYKNCEKEASNNQESLTMNADWNMFRCVSIPEELSDANVLIPSKEGMTKVNEWVIVTEFFTDLVTAFNVDLR